MFQSLADLLAYRLLGLVPGTPSGFLGHMAEGRIDPILAGVTVVSVILGSQMGAWFMATRARPGWVKKLYGIVLLGVAAKLLHGVWSH